MSKTYIGKIVGTFGIKGELKVYSESYFIEERFKKGNEIILKSNKTEISVKVSSCRIHKNNVLITINDLYNINDVEKYISYDIYTLQELELDEDEYYIDDLVGLDVYNDKNILIGKVIDVISIPSNDILEVEKNGKKVLIPFINDYIVEINDKIIIKEMEIM
jgi:16S rRNA processing protein RimM